MPNFYFRWDADSDADHWNGNLYCSGEENVVTFYKIIEEHGVAKVVPVNDEIEKQEIKQRGHTLLPHNSQKVTEKPDDTE